MRLLSAISERIPRESRAFLNRWTRSVLGLLWGVVLSLPLLAAGIGGQHSSLRSRVLGWEQKRQERSFGIVLGSGTPRRSFFLLHGLLAAGLAWPAFSLVQGFVYIVIGSLVQTFFGSGTADVSLGGFTFSQPSVLVGVLYGVANLVGLIILAELADWVHGIIDARHVEVSRPHARQTRIGELLTTRQGVVMAIDDERRRIERDLHDGVQQNVVSLSVLIARARRAKDPEKADELLAAALAQSQDLIDEMREVAWRIYPTSLDEHGLATVLAGLADHCPVPVTIAEVPAVRLPTAVESATYFIVREAVTNVVKHAEAESILISVIADGALVIAEVVDDGCGGADVTGSGLQGLGRRVGALDGRLSINSPGTIGTTVRAEIPYA